MIESRLLGWSGRVAACVLAISLTITPGVAADDSKDAWAALVKGGHVALIRHGNAPPGYGGDPPGFKIDDCTTQRNLDEIGREEARAIGDAFRSHGVRVDRILSSPWCRCLETARLMGVGPVETSWALVPDMEPSVHVRLSELKEMVAAWRGPGTLVLVTHAFTVRALLGFLPSQGETVVLKPESGSSAGADLVGLIAAPIRNGWPRADLRRGEGAGWRHTTRCGFALLSEATRRGDRFDGAHDSKLQRTACLRCLQRGGRGVTRTGARREEGDTMGLLPVHVVSSVVSAVQP